MRRLLVYLPCYNEAENIAPLTEEWILQKDTLAAAGYQLEIMPIDDKSADSTLEVMLQLAKTFREVRPIAHEINQNLGGVLMTALKDFEANAGAEDYMCFMDGDNTHKPVFVHSMLRKVESGYDCVIASRYQTGANVLGLESYRKFLSFGARVYYSMMLHIPNVRDYTCGYRVYTHKGIRKGLKRYGDKLVEMKNFSCMMELLYKLHCSGCTFAEVPFTLYYDSKIGESKMNVGGTVKDSLRTALKLRVARNRHD